MSNPRTHPARYQPTIHPGVKLEKEYSPEEEHELLHKAGKLAANVRDTVAKATKPGASVLDLCMTADDMIRKADAIPAFPINISINDMAAHYTATIDDSLTIPDVGVVKVDVGAQYEGYIADTAESVDLDGSFAELVNATVEATNTAIKAIRPGTMTGDLGAVIETVIKNHGVEPIQELSGHLVERYVVHAGKTVPCVGKYRGDLVEEGEVYAIETFASTGVGSVHADINKITIFRASPLRVKVRSKGARAIVKHAIHTFGGTPFAARALLTEGMSKAEILTGMRELQNVGGIIEYHVLRCQDNTSMSSQYEHTMIIKEDGAEVTTNL